MKCKKCNRRMSRGDTKEVCYFCDRRGSINLDEVMLVLSNVQDMLEACGYGGNNHRISQVHHNDLRRCREHLQDIASVIASVIDSVIDSK